jgi:purine-binding chemotaxis protein CheW
MVALVRARERRAVRRAGEAGRRVEYLAFVLAGETYAVQIAPITEVPRAPATMLGVTSVRGKLVTVISLRRRLALPEAAVDRRSRILLADLGKGEQLGLLVDEVQQVWRLAPEEMEAASVLGGEQPAHLAGIGRPSGADGTVLILLELRPILESP